MPDGVFIEIVDPFTVFSTEGAPDPQPSQTESGILLAGGKNVIYKYSEQPGGSQANVLMIGGYGTNVLSGGTMSFGNFVPAARAEQAKQHFGNISGYDTATQAYIDSSITSTLAPATPAGIIGATMIGRRGGLMVGGPGNNSFYAEGPGNYEMVGGTWINNFTISPSFGGVPATYQIDGGPYGKSNLVVLVPPDENVVFENSTVNDKYNAEFKALAVTANAGVSATAHGIKKVQVVSKPGPSVLIGDTSLLDTEFAIRGGAELTFGGTNAPDIFSVTTTGPYHGLANHFSPPRITRFITTDPAVPPRIFLSTVWGENWFPLADPVYTVTRTFGTNGRTQTIPFAVGNAASSSIKLNAGGASDNYSINVGLGAFIDIEIKDTDTSTTNALTVTTGDSSLIYNSLKFTDTSVEFDYYTTSYLWSTFTESNTYYPYFSHMYMSSAHYTPTVKFSSNVAPTVRTAIPFLHTTINRPLAAQAAEFYIGGGVPTTPIPYQGLGAFRSVWDVLTQPWTNFVPDYSSTAVQILANGGTLLIADNTLFINFNSSSALSINVLGNAGTLSFVNSSQGVWNNATTLNIQANSGTIDVSEASYGSSNQPRATLANVTVGSNGSLASISGEINLTTPGGLMNLKIDDRQNPGPADSWQSLGDKTIIGDLTINHVVNQSGYVDFVTKYEAFPKPGSLFIFENPPRFHFSNVSGTAFPIDLFLTSRVGSGRRGETVQVQATVHSNTEGTLTYSAIDLPPGLSISSSGLITGTISETAIEAVYISRVQVVRNGTYARSSLMTWSVGSAIQISDPEAIYATLQIEGMSPPSDPLTATNLFNRPVAFTATNLPPGITLNNTTGRFEGTYAVGSAQNGPYLTTIHATDGTDAASIEFAWYVTGITVAVPNRILNRIGDMVDVPLSISIASGDPGTVEVYNLPDGLTFNPETRRISGIISEDAPLRQYVFVNVANGNDSGSGEFLWIVLPVGISNYVAFDPMSDRYMHESATARLQIPIYDSLNLPLTVEATGLPPGLHVQQGEGDWEIGGTIGPGAAAQSPYRVQLVATDGLWSGSTEFEISVGIAGTVSFDEFAGYDDRTYQVTDLISDSVQATSSLGETITYSAVGLPPGFSIDSATGLIEGQLVPGWSVPIHYQVTLMATTVSSTDRVKFLWIFINSYENRNTATLLTPNELQVSSPAGSELFFSYTSTLGPSRPSGVNFPYDYFNYTIRRLEPGQSADLTFVGFNLAAFSSYRQYGATPANPTEHWYEFLLDQATDSDNALGTGMEIVNGNLVLHLVDGGRGDADRTKNGVITGAGGPSKKLSLPPIISGFGGTVTYTEGGPPVVLDSDVVVIDADSPSLAGGILTVSTVNGEATDRVRVKHTGNGPGQIGTDAYNILYEGKLVGTFTGAKSLVVRLNAQATPAAVQTLLRNVTFASVSRAPDTTARLIRVRLTDGDGGTSQFVSSTVNVVAVNERPEIGGFDGQVTYIENSPPVLLDDDVTVRDFDSFNFDTGKLTIAIIHNPEATDRLRFSSGSGSAGQISVRGTTVSYDGVVIGTFTGASYVVVSLNAYATPTAVQALLRSVTYTTVSDTPSTLDRTVRVYLNDGDGSTSFISLKTIKVIAANDAPVISGANAPVIYISDRPAVPVAPATTISDPDSINFDTGVLQLTTTAGGQATDLFAIEHQGFQAGLIGVSGANIMYGDILIGTQSGGVGLTPLTITLNAQASVQAVQALLQAVTWRSTLADLPISPRTFSIRLTDGDGGTALLTGISIEIKPQL